VKKAKHDKLLKMGKITGVHGLKGALKLAAHVQSPKEIFAMGRVINIITRLESQPYIVQKLIPHGTDFLLFLDGITTRTVAEKLVGGQIEISRSELPDLEESAYYWHDLIGLHVSTDTGKDIGILQSIIETGSNDVYVIQKGKKEVLLPAIESVILSIDMVAGQMRVKIPKGLEEIN